MEKVNVAIIGPGNIGQDLMIKIARSEVLNLHCVVNIKESPGLERARQMGAYTSTDSVNYLLAEHSDDVEIVFDATSATAHEACAERLKEAGFFTLDLTPAAIGPYCVPTVNLSEEMLAEPELNLVTCAGQATVPMVHAVNEVADVYYAEIVASLASLSAGPGTRANIDEFTETTRAALESIGGADRGKAIIILNPAEPPIFMRNTIYTRVRNVDMEAIKAACARAMEEMREFVPGTRWRMEPTLLDPDGDTVMMMIEIEGLGDYLPVYSGNLDIINAAAVYIAEIKARQLLERRRSGGAVKAEGEAES
ncbi:MAG: acetaldehyde dehydrogenase (acetylating) [Bacillota bacterium]|nr:acetaldehyde dehydrogenase (acetylating) [Bacillota bacterium]